MQGIIYKNLFKNVSLTYALTKGTILPYTPPTMNDSTETTILLITGENKSIFLKFCKEIFSMSIDLLILSTGLVSKHFILYLVNFPAA